MRAFSAGNPLVLRNPDATRPWQHVLDPLRGYLMLAQRLTEDPAQWSGPWNFGPAEDDALPVSVIADELTRLWGEGARWQAHGPQQSAGTARESRQLVLSSSQAMSRLDWLAAGLASPSRPGGLGRMVQGVLRAAGHVCVFDAADFSGRGEQLAWPPP